MTQANHQPAFTVDIWGEFTHKGVSYDLAHLRAYDTMFERPLLPGKPVERYSVKVSFSHHCFTKGLPAPGGEEYDFALRYDHRGDRRLFDARRWQLSKQLPTLIAGMQGRKCLRTGRGNFLSVQVVDENGADVEYEIYFRTWKPSRGRIQMHIESAYVRDPLDTDQPGFGASRRKGVTPIAFLTILHNTLNQIPIKH